MTYSYFQRLGLRLLLLIVPPVAMAAPARVLAQEPCHLDKAGDCCSVTVAPGEDVQVRTKIVDEQTVNYLTIRNNQPYTCDFIFNGDMVVPMRIRPNDFKTTWIGGNFSLAYHSDEGNQAMCVLDVFDGDSEDLDKEHPIVCKNQAE